ncbi:hypothetical protein [Microbacterium sp. TNHR37B]|uniref:hypothetical protein n=1 Tax=Microbacterium sp. TNHR37B TaxID=1775956 RepID=UPI0012F939EC|nr:hypothetical protein [Microbacterium sp. TNHR37B]
MPRPPSALPSDLGSAFGVREAREAGVTPARLRASDLSSPFHGVRVRQDATETEQSDDVTPLARDRAERDDVLRRARGYAQVAPAGAFFVARTAAVIWGLPVRHGPSLEVGVWDPARAPRGRGVRGIKVLPALADVTETEGLPVTTPASTWAMLGRWLTIAELVTVGDAIIRVPRDERGRRCPDACLATAGSLAAAVARGRRVGIVRLREVLPLLRSGSASPLESEFRIDAEAAGLPAPTLDAEIRDDHGRLLGISEFVYPRWRLVVEIEGDHHRTNRRQWDRDIEKYAAYTAEGWDVVRLTARHVRSRDGVEMVKAALRRRGWR